MKIDSTTMVMVSNRFQEETHTEVEELKVWTDPPVTSSVRDTVRLSEQMKAILETKEEKTAALDSEEVIKNNPKLQLIKQLVEALTGKEIRLGKMPSGSGDPQDVIVDARSEGGAGEQSNRVGWGIRYEYHETYLEKEETTFAAAGIIKTDDGQEIKFTLNLTMSREFYQSTDISFRAGDALLDPLVVNFAGNAASLSDQKFTFDLDSDGTDESMPFVAAGSGLLVLDRNNDQTVNDGSELFGPSTGNGFRELAVFDETKDGWIDENDSIYDRLSIWTKGEAGGDHLQSLKKRGVGAIYVSAAETSFDLKNRENQLDGRIKRTGIYLSEGGQAGTVQQIDVAV